MRKPKVPKKLIKDDKPRKCMVCQKTKESQQFSKTYVFLCETCYEKR